MSDASARLLDVCEKIARDAPRRRGQNVSHCLVYWDDIIELRAALVELRRANETNERREEEHGIQRKAGEQ